jgi:tetratricopeptide (TPR) repeat protein/Zn-dependent protease
VALKFRILGVPVAIGADFIVVMVVLGSLLRPPELLPEWLIVVTGSVLLHELAHAAVFNWCGMRSSIRLHGGGGVTTGLRLPPRRMALVAAAGPVMGLLIGGIVGAAVLARPSLSDLAVVQDLLWINLGWSLINLMPFPGLDGGTILGELTTLVMGRPAERATRIVGLAFAAAVFIALVAVGLYDWASVIAFVGLFTTVRMGFLSDVLVGKRQDSAVNLLIEGRYDEAFALARSQMAANPDDFGAVVVASDALRLMTRYADALWGYDLVLSRIPGAPHALRGRICTLLLGRRPEAEADLARLMALPHAEHAVTQASALYQANRYADGYSLLRDALAVAGAAQRQHFESMTAVFEYALGMSDQALRRTDAALAEAPGNAALHELRALILVNLGRFDEARASARHALAGAPRHPEFHQTMGLVERISGNAPAALDHLTGTAVACPYGSRPRSELAACFVALGRIPEASAALDALPAYDAGDPFVLYARATVAAAAGKSDEAAAFVAAATAIRPELGIRAGLDPLLMAAHG